MATVTLIPTQDLDQFNLDLRDWFGVSRVAVGKQQAAYFQEDGQELVITPRPKLHAGRTYTVEVDYAACPRPRRPGRQLRGLGQEPRRRFRRQRAAGLAGLVPRQRRPERQGDLRLRDHGARRARSRSATGACSPRSPTAARPRGAGARTRRWPLPHHGDQRRLRPPDPRRARTACRSTTRSTRGTRRDGFERPKAAALRFAAQPQIIQFFTDLWGRTRSRAPAR